jgi:multiple sugar transport system permease protein
MDGAGNWRIWLQVLMPLSQPVIATVAIFSFILGWTDFLDPLIYINSMEKRTVALGLSAFVDVSYQTSFVYMMAATVLTTLPVMAVFLAFQRYFTRGITLTGLGGR